ncbi:MAG: hypothetical protein K2J99_14570 [Lachnospiraceae bacterium]|nr:hypothetical protein [Lachnospiraceae bacterium]
MTLDDFQRLLTCALYDQNEICHILNSNGSLLVSCDDESNFYINILESKWTFIHNDCEEKYAREYLATHTDEDFAEDILSMTTCHLGFFLYFMIFTKLEEMGIIDRGLFYHLNDSIVHYEDELSLFIAELLAHINLSDNGKD